MKLFEKKLLFISAVLIVVLILAGCTSPEWTPEKEKEAIGGCNKWGGKIIYDSHGHYVDCDINRSLRD